MLKYKKSFFLQLLASALLLFSSGLIAQVKPVANKSISIEPGEKWYGGTVDDGLAMPFKSGYSFDLYGNNKDNQSAPLLLSTKGRYIWSNQPFKFTITDREIMICNAYDSVLVGSGGKSLSAAFKKVSQKEFPASGKMPDPLLFTRPQYNTWIELVYNQNQTDILKYAHAIINNGFPPGVLMIDDNWMDFYGKFSFRKDRFPDPVQMVKELHQLGFKVMVWVCPFISSDTQIFRDLSSKKLLLMSNKGNPTTAWNQATDPAIINWWNGYSASLDFTNPEAITWYKEQLQGLVDNYGIDGFKFDAGDIEFYTGNVTPFKALNANEQCSLYGNFGLMFPLNEFRAMWKQGGQPLAERLRDKKHNWQDIQKLIPNITAAGLLGYQFTCPDMIGGGEYGSFIGVDKLDQDLVVRSAECSALMPMMQFSVAPWRILDPEHLKAVKQSVALRMKYTPYILQTVKESAQTGEPVIRNLEYNFPGQGLEEIKDQFMLGKMLMVAPMIEKGTRRKIIFPKGKWLSETGKFFKGPITKKLDVALDKILVFKKIL
ncbi:MAG: glycoside hydrolase family 31 protein [Janthinobacterium lividum]